MATPSFSDLYPERRGGKVSPSVFQRATGAGHPHSIKTLCERNVTWSIENMPMVKTMISALKVNFLLIKVYFNHYSNFRHQVVL